MVPLIAKVPSLLGAALIAAGLLLAWGLGQPIPPAHDLWWGAAGGLMGLVAVLAFFRALALGPMGAVSVAAGALSAVVPVIFGVLAGEAISRFVSPQTLKLIAGIGFVAIGAWTLYSAWKPA